MRRVVLTMGVLLVALLPVTAAVSADAAAPPEIPVAITQPVGHIASALGSGSPVIPEPGLIILVGSGLIGLASVVRRSTRV